MLLLCHPGRRSEGKVVATAVGGTGAAAVAGELGAAISAPICFAAFVERVVTGRFFSSGGTGWGEIVEDAVSGGSGNCGSGDCGAGVGRSAVSCAVRHERRWAVILPLSAANSATARTWHDYNGDPLTAAENGGEGD